MSGHTDQSCSCDAEQTELKLAEEACELMLLRASRLGWPRQGNVVSHSSLGLTGPKGDTVTVVQAEFEFAGLCERDGETAISGFVVAYCPEAFYFCGRPVFQGASQDTLKRALQQVTDRVTTVAQRGQCSNCGTYDLPTLQSVGSVNPWGEAYAVYMYSCSRCGHRTVDVLD